ncbi:hypothetical protein KEM56_000132 [Ascosphaera pollenicola]|nr:hypothetical protein KEM56_000132 [Ascosphaera pollenicola]
MPPSQQGHAAIQGTARSAKYDVLLDEVFSHMYSRGVPPKFGSIQDVVESFNLGLCYIYGRATKAVSLCTPAKYADMACERARCYLSHYFIDDKSSDTSKEALYKKIRPHDRIKESMFYL